MTDQLSALREEPRELRPLSREDVRLPGNESCVVAELAGCVCACVCGAEANADNEDARAVVGTPPHMIGGATTAIMTCQSYVSDDEFLSIFLLTLHTPTHAHTLRSLSPSTEASSPSTAAVTGSLENAHLNCLQSRLAGKLRAWGTTRESATLP